MLTILPMTAEQQRKPIRHSRRKHIGFAVAVPVLGLLRLSEATRILRPWRSSVSLANRTSPTCSGSSCNNHARPGYPRLRDEQGIGRPRPPRPPVTRRETAMAPRCARSSAPWRPWLRARETRRKLRRCLRDVSAAPRAHFPRRASGRGFRPAGCTLRRGHARRRAGGWSLAGSEEDRTLPLITTASSASVVILSDAARTHPPRARPSAPARNGAARRPTQGPK